MGGPHAPLTPGKPLSIQLIQQYYSNVERLIRYGGTRNEMPFHFIPSSPAS
jgi:hypothetical protein